LSCPDGDERIARELADLAPVHALLGAERRHVDAVAGREILHGREQRLLARQAA
jgi:hypothetical protein